MSRLSLLACCLISILCLASTAPAAEPGEADPAVLRIALLPDEDPATIIANNRPLKTYLETTLGKTIELVVTPDYTTMIAAMANGQLELGYFGPLSYVLAKQSCAIEPFACLVKHGHPTYTAVIIAGTAAKIATLGDLKGKQLAFGDLASTSSHLVPKGMLFDAGLRTGTDYQETFLGNHDAVALAVQNGHADAGGIGRHVYDSLIEKQILDSGKVVIVAESAQYPQYPWTMRSDLDPALRTRIAEAFVGLKDPAILKAFKAEAFAPSKDADYDVIRALAKKLGLELDKLAK
ncbi:MAG: phosphate/phosphite/phosphonate ABC transporter substrate-binding protein [Planctomycetes bacterium]|nr:phosphate/phosphite/phosphonate ABC transporter substrate-binding protein [Planctomycetota bacterium]